ncbi:MAG: hypothetical protein JWQ27_1932 [Ferruginibacter sp.]|nr:hypothetical protein [Ferruginibacter sp.]
MLNKIKANMMLKRRKVWYLTAKYYILEEILNYLPGV